MMDVPCCAVLTRKAYADYADERSLRGSGRGTPLYDPLPSSG